MVVRTPNLVYIYLSIVSRQYMNENKVFFSLSLSTKRKPHRVIMGTFLEGMSC